MKINIEGLGTVEASGNTLNTLGISCEQAADFFKLKGLFALSDVYKQYSNSFYKELEKLGYYTRKDR